MRRIGPARGLWQFLVHKQNRPDGRVWHGKAITYAWIRSKIPHSPPQRTLRRWMARLVSEGFIEQSLVSRKSEGKGYIVGFTVRILNQMKFDVPKQRPLFAPPAPVKMPVQKPVDNLWISGAIQEGGTASFGRRVRPEVAGQRFKSLKQAYETRKSAAPIPIPGQTQAVGTGPAPHDLIPCPDELHRQVEEIARRKAM
jgi:hypothetical protein